MSALVFVFLPITEDWRTRVSRVKPQVRLGPVASSPSRTFPAADISFIAFEPRKDCCGETPQPARETGALPNQLLWTWFIENPRPHIPL